MIPVEEFLALHPEHADDDENKLMIARIEHERTEREALEQQRMELLKRKQKLIADNKKRKDDLANLDKELEKFIDVRILHIALLIWYSLLTCEKGRETHPETLRQERLTKTCQSNRETSCYFRACIKEDYSGIFGLNRHMLSYSALLRTILGLKSCSID